MKYLYRALFLIGFYVMALSSWGQQKIALEQIQVFSSINPTASYWQLPNNIQPLLQALDTGLFLKMGMRRDTSIVTKQIHLTKQNQLGKININWSGTRDFDFHAYLELYEMNPDFIYKNNLVDIPETKKDSIHSFWVIAVSVFNQKQEKVLQKTILLGLTPIASLGIGYKNQASASTPYYIYNAVSKAISMFSPEANEMEFMDAKLPSAYTTDNYWMPYVHNQPRTLIDTSKSFISYNNANGLHLLRTPAAVLNKINLKDKNPNYPYKNMVGIIKKNRINYFNNEYYHVIQNLRGVKNNYDYTLEGYMEFNTEVPSGMNLLALIFLPDSVHKIYNDRDSIGFFVVKDLVMEKDKFNYGEIIYNGYDSTKQFALTEKATKNKYPIVHIKSIDGKIYNTPFSIKLSADNNIKTIFINQKMALIVVGKNKPIQMVEVDKEVSEKIKDFLLMMSYSEIFQTPN
jgi:hypothetical protein